MADKDIMTIVVVSEDLDHSVLLESILGPCWPIECIWVADVVALTDTLSSKDADLLCVFIQHPAQPLAIAEAVRVRNIFASELPILAAIAGDEAGEEGIASAMRAGARDMVSLSHRDRLQAVVARELEGVLQKRALEAAMSSGKEAKYQIQALAQRSGHHAILHAQEGIILDANPAWLELFGYANVAMLIHTPLLELFEEGSHAALKGALEACARGEWEGHSLRAKGLRSDASTITITLRLEAASFDGKRCMRVFMDPEKTSSRELEARLLNASNEDSLTGFYHRRHFLNLLRQRVKKPSKGGVRALVYTQLDNVSGLSDQVGPLMADDILVEFASLIRDLVQPNDLYGRSGEHVFSIFMERGTSRDAETWAESLRSRLANHLFELADKSISVTCSIGISILSPHEDDISSLIIRAQKANKAASDAGGNKVNNYVPEIDDGKETNTGMVPIEVIRVALTEQRFRLVYQVIANLHGQSLKMFDVMVRMVGSDDEEILPAQFLPTAEKHRLMRDIDRRILTTALTFCARQTLAHVFVRISCDSLLDESLPTWIQKQIETIAARPEQLVLQIAELDIEIHLKETHALVTRLWEIGCKFAIEHFGVGRQPLQVLKHVPTNYVKVDGSLMQGLTIDNSLQEKVKGFVNIAKEKDIVTIAERVQDANTMAVLWHVGVDFVQGYYIQEPEEIILGGH